MDFLNQKLNAIAMIVIILSPSVLDNALINTMIRYVGERV